MLDEPDDRPEDPGNAGAGENSASDGVTLDRIAHYRIEGVAARGGESVVYRATDGTLERTVALKVIEDVTESARLIQEARNTSQLAHPGIAAVYQAGVDEKMGCAFVAFEWVEGSTLRNHLRGSAAPLDALLRYTEKIAEAVAYAHDQGWVHGDLKADNIVLTVGDGQVKLIDFGLSTAVEGFEEGEIWGTPAYMAPELFEGAPRSVSTDLFALGVLLYEIATGSLPFGGADGDENKVRRAQDEEPKDVRECEPTVPTPLAQMIHSLISLDPAKRGPTATEVARWARHARQPGGRATRWLIPIAVLISIGIGAFATHGSWWGVEHHTRNGGAPSAGRNVPEREPEWLVIGEWTGPESDPDLTRLLHDVLILSVNGDDPGSALLEPRAVPAGARAIELSGRWGRRDGRFFAEWDDGSGVSQTASSNLGGADMIAAIVEALWSSSRGTATVVNTRATTLCAQLGALEQFVVGVRDAERGAWSEAIDRFEKARQEAGTFPEATAWEAAIRLAQGEFERSAVAATLLRDHPSKLCRVLGDTLTTPTRNRDSRWGRTHRLARLVDLTFDIQDPRSSDQGLIERLQSDLGIESSHYTREALRLFYRYDRRELARVAFDRLEAYGETDDAWRVTFYRWRLKAPISDALPPAGWMLRRRPPTDFLTIPYFLHDGDLAAALDRSGEPLGPPDAYAAAAMALAIGGRFDESLRLAGQLSRPFDRGWGERMRSAVHALAGDWDAAADALHNARDHDPKHPKTLFLLDYLDRDPYSVAPLGESPVSDFTRWHNGFSALHSAREAEDVVAARNFVSGVGWVDSELQVIEWPELAYLAWTERIRLLLRSGEREAAIQAMVRFREWWPNERAPLSRVSIEAKRLEVLIDGAQ